jgi:hypothetical protein
LNTSNAQTGVKLSTCIQADKDRLRQRFVYLGLIYSTVKNVSTTWFAAANECTWTGITCTTNRVNKLDLSRQTLQGTIPDDVSLWTGMNEFNVRINNLSGSLPSSIGAWKYLTAFSVAGNNLSGPLPPAIGAWTYLQSFDVGSNKFSGAVPTELSKWTNIYSAYFDTNRLNGTMPTIGSNFCPKSKRSGDLFADCGASAMIVCSCCNQCF